MPSPRGRLRTKLSPASQCPPTQPPPARPPCRLRAKGRVRTRCAPPAAPPRPDRTHVQLSPERGSHPEKAAEPVRRPLLPLSRWLSETQGLRPSPPYPQKPTGRSPRPGATLTLFGAPAGRSVFSLPAGLDANVEKDGSSASLTAMSDSPGGCLRAEGRRESGGHSRPPPRRGPPALTPPCAPRCTYLINVGALEGPRESEAVEVPEPQSQRRVKDLDRSQNQNPKLPESLLLWIKYK